MKTIKNDRVSYKSRAVIGGLKGEKTPKKEDPKRRDFDVDPRGYLVWGNERMRRAR